MEETRGLIVDLVLLYSPAMEETFASVVVGTRAAAGYGRAWSCAVTGCACRR